MKMIKNSILSVTILLVTALYLLCYADEDEHRHHDEAHLEHKDEHGYAESTTIGLEIAREVGIDTAIAEQGVIQQTVTAYGRLYTASEQMSHIRARFPGLVSSVKAQIGDEVRAGDLLAKVESNESLKTYDILAPISGVVIERHANAGEFTGDQTLFAIASFNTLWLELNIFPSQRARVRPGQTIQFQYDTLHLKTRISHLVPAQNGQPFVLARASVNNEEGFLTPGLLVEAKIVVKEKKYPLVVLNSGLQILDNKIGVFLREGTTYTHAPLKIGVSDNKYTQVLSGLDAGAEYVINNAYLIKADIEKSEAEHVH